MLPLLLSLLSVSAFAEGVEMTYVERFKAAGFRCTTHTAIDSRERGQFDGYNCVGTLQSTPTYVSIPSNLPRRERSVFYAHGDVGVCGNGASGENYLKDKMQSLREANSIGIMPFRGLVRLRNGNVVRTNRDTSFALGPYLDQLDAIMADGRTPWTLAGHSWGGKLISSLLFNDRSIAARVDNIFLLDAAYDVDQLMTPFLLPGLAGNPAIKIKAISVTTYNNNTNLTAAVNRKYPGMMKMKSLGGSHCGAPNYFYYLARPL